MSLLDLPVDILLLVFPYLDVSSFVALTSTCSALHSSAISDYSGFWSSATRSTFRVPNQPVVQNDGKRWQKLYKRLRTQSRVFTWGNNAKANLGHSFEILEPGWNPSADMIIRRRRVMRGRHVSWPQEMDHTQDLGIIADLQSGGWSTTLLTSGGALHSVGVLDGMQTNPRRPPYHQQIKTRPERLLYPPGFPHPSERYDSATAIQQFSSGRAHVLGLSDSGRIWSWNNIEQAALNVKFLNVELAETRGPSASSAVKKVVAGWNKSSALVAGTGIVLWEPLSRSHDEAEIEDAALVLETAVVPGTSYQRSKVSNRGSTLAHSSDNEQLGEVLNYICLEHFVVFQTHLGRLFAGRIRWADHEPEISDPFEIDIERSSSLYPTALSSKSRQGIVTDVQGSFRSFAVFTNDGRVYTGNQDHLQARFDRPLDTNTLAFVQIPALQHTQVISLAFGDYHFHALHAPGYITSYGCESQGCGSLGLGGHGDPEGRLRGLRYAGVGGDGRLVTHAYSSGRRVWFEREKQEWIRFLTSGGNDPEEARERMRMCADPVVQGEVSEWVEQQGNAWETMYHIDTDDTAHNEDDDGLGAYFALSVTAAGWHSGALVLVNDAMADQVREGCLVRAKPAVQDTIEGEDEENTSSPVASTRFVSSALALVNDWGRWFLGLAPYAPATSSANSKNEASSSEQRGRVTQTYAGRSRFVDPVNHGAAIDEHTRYKWADDPFPRLLLRDGREMPGTAPFSEWRDGIRPEWDMSFQQP